MKEYTSANEEDLLPEGNQNMNLLLDWCDPPRGFHYNFGKVTRFRLQKINVSMGNRMGNRKRSYIENR
jgi:hypothetical protein